MTVIALIAEACYARQARFWGAMMKRLLPVVTAGLLAACGPAFAQTVPVAPYQGCDLPAVCSAVNQTVVPTMNSKLPHLLFQTGASVATGTGTTEQTLATYSLPAGALDVVGRNLRITAHFQTAANVNTKTPKLYFGSEALATAGITTSAAGAILQALVVKTGASTQNVSLWGIGGAAGVTPVTSMITGAETDTSAITIKATCTDGTSSASDCVLAGMTVEYLN